MNNKKTLFLLIPSVLLGALITYFSINMFFSDLCNMYNKIHDFCIFSSFPSLFIALDLLFFSSYLIKVNSLDSNKKIISNNFALKLLVCSILGIIFSILSGTLTYHDLIGKYPFKGYTISMLIFHSLILIESIFLFIKTKGEKNKIQIKNVVYSILFGCFVFYSFYKLGALLASPVYVSWQSLYLTFPFYVSLLLPILLVIHIVLIRFQFYKKRNIEKVIFYILIGVSLLLGLTVILLGFNSTEFIKDISMALPLERILLLPIGAIIQPLIILVISILYLVKINKENK